MLERVHDLVAVGADFVLETTLASLTYARKIPQWRKRGYHVSLIYLRLESRRSIAAPRPQGASKPGDMGFPDEGVRRRFTTRARVISNAV
jgi:predicted ABC-type ATPase